MTNLRRWKSRDSQILINTVQRLSLGKLLWPQEHRFSTRLTCLQSVPRIHFSDMLTSSHKLGLSLLSPKDLPPLPWLGFRCRCLFCAWEVSFCLILSRFMPQGITKSSAQDAKARSCGTLNHHADSSKLCNHINFRYCRIARPQPP